MAEKIVRNTEKKAAEPAKKAAEPAKKPAAAKKPQTVITPNKPTGGSTVGLRIGACVLWLLAIVCEVFAIMALLEYFYPPFNMTLFLIIAIVLDMVFAIIAAQLWKKANHIKPMSEKRGKFLFYLWNELGVIMACICFIPLIVLLLKNDKLDKKTKLIATIVAVVALLITGVASADFNRRSSRSPATYTGLNSATSTTSTRTAAPSRTPTPSTRAPSPRPLRPAAPPCAPSAPTAPRRKAWTSAT